ncbi:hypothetical protein [Parasedimentitalea psychrophila]|uniref:Uncharacterized protein n=1 Tax=Parasedimentitalea psychrophila TaxID=2997337 RepID=A0A9Y2P7Q3_9RHOB|nr:hypothetical protein [Parasedimentitalea psychrophila]WIY26268.1 hypothetical protein QPJ95_04905 [Parasedimentitalea psychrophila]
MTGQHPDQDSKRSASARLYDQPRPVAITHVEIWALVISVLWVLGAGWVGFSGGDQATDLAGLHQLMAILVVLMPVLMVWVAAITIRSSKAMREESQRLHAAIDGLRAAYVMQQQLSAAGSEPSVSKKLDEIAEATRKTETTLATFHSTRRDTPRAAIPTPKAEQPAEDQGLLALGTTAEDIAATLSMTDFIRALNFPETAEDEEGFAALRQALQDRKAAQIIQAAQDVLTLLSQDGIYMDDLRPDMARPEIWRQFAQGARGRPVAALGGVRDRTSLALTAARMKQDPIFRDAAHHFLRRFDQMFSEFESDASDSEVAALGETRTARAFMLLGRVAGTFD